MAEVPVVKSDVKSLAIDTFPQLLEEHARVRSDRPAYREKHSGIWKEHGWGDVARQVRFFAQGLASLGFSAGDKLIIIGDNRPELYWAMTAAQALGGVPVPLYPESDIDEIAELITRCEVRFALGEDQEQVDKLLEIRQQGGSLEQVVYKNPRGMRHYAEVDLNSFTEVQQRGRIFQQQYPDFYADTLAQRHGDEVAVILHTSGSTGSAKGVVHTHRGLIQTALNVAQHQRYRTDEKGYAYLPIAWIGDFILSYTVPMVVGYCVHIPEDNATMLVDLREVAPTIFLAPPFVYEILLSRASIRMLDAGKRTRAVYHYFMNLAERVGPRIRNEEPVGAFDRLMYAIGERLIYGPVKNVLGLSDIRTCYTAGEVISQQAFTFMRALGVNLKQLYGQTESAGYVAAHVHAEARAQYVGRAIKGMEVKLGEDGEILYRGDGVFKEYYDDPQATAAVKDTEGWVHSGDYGAIDADGEIRIIDRMKSLEAMNDGGTFSPRTLEGRLKESFYIKEAVTFADPDRGVVAIVNVDPESVGDWAERNQVGYTGYRELAGQSAVYDLIQAELERLNRELAQEAAQYQVRRFVILHKLLTSRDGEITRTAKLRRHLLVERYQALVDALNSEATSFLLDEGHQSFDLKLREVARV